MYGLGVGMGVWAGSRDGCSGLGIWIGVWYGCMG